MARPRPNVNFTMPEKFHAGLFDFLRIAGQCSAGMKLFTQRFLHCCLTVWFLAGIAAQAQTTWGYVPTNAFPSLVFSNPTCITAPPGETNRLFVVEKHGRIIVITNLAAPTRTIFMDISSEMSLDNPRES